MTNPSPAQHTQEPTTPAQSQADEALAVAAALDPGEEPIRRFKRFARDWIRPLLLALIILTPVRSSIADWNDVPTGSMMPTILVGDRIFVNKLAYGLRVPLTRTWITRWNEPERGSIIICHSPADDTRLVKRVVAIAGDTLQIRGGQLYINGRRPAYSDVSPDVLDSLREEQLAGHRLATETVDGVSHAVMHTPGLPRIRMTDPMVVPEGRVFVMGDNRDQSLDSRAFGLVSTDQVLGKVGRVVASVDPDNYFCPRFGRFFQKID